MALSGGSLFSGIGGFEAGAHLACLDVDWVWQVEIEPSRRVILEKKWPRCDRSMTDVRTAHPRPVDVLCGGFPCTNISHAGKREGLRGEKSGLWFEMLRVVEETSPRIVLVENVEPWSSYLPTVRRGLHGVGYSSVCFLVRADEVGAPFRGSRIFTIAAPHLNSKSARPLHEETSRVRELAKASGAWCGAIPSGVRVADGVPSRLDRIRALGDSIVPWCAAAVWLRAKEICGR